MTGARHTPHATPALRVILTAVALAAGAANPAPAADDLRLVEAARRNDPGAVRVLLAEGLEVDARHPDGATALFWAAHYDDAETAALLIAAGADVDAANDYGESPLSQASRTHNPEIMRALLAAGADPHLAASDGTTPLAAAAGTRGRPPMGYSRRLDTPRMLQAVRTALDAGADVNAANAAGRTAMHGAAAIRSTALIELLAVRGARVDVEDNEGQTPLDLATQGGGYRDADADGAAELLRKLTVPASIPGSGRVGLGVRPARRGPA